MNFGKSAKKNGKAKYYVVEGKICLGNRWDDDNSEEFHIRFEAIHFFHAKRVALGRLKAFARRSLERNGQRRFVLQGVSLSSCVGHKKSALRPNCKNNGLLFQKSVEKVFY